MKKGVFLNRAKNFPFHLLLGDEIKRILSFCVSKNILFKRKRFLISRGNGRLEKIHVQLDAVFLDILNQFLDVFLDVF